MTTIGIDNLLDPVKDAPSEGDALRRLLRAQETALKAVKGMVASAAASTKDEHKGKMEAIEKELDALLSGMMLDSGKVEATLKGPRSKRPIDPTDIEQRQQAEQSGSKQQYQR